MDKWNGKKWLKWESMQYSTDHSCYNLIVIDKIDIYSGSVLVGLQWTVTKSTIIWMIIKNAESNQSVSWLTPAQP